MRTTTITDSDSYTYTLKIADELTFAFNPFIFVVSGDYLASAVFTITDGTTTQTDTRQANNGEIYADLRAYVQALFDGTQYGGQTLDESQDSMTATAKSVTMSIQVINTDNNTSDATSFSSVVVWGAIRWGETFNARHDVMWFTNFPFTLPYYAVNGDLLRVSIDGGMTQTLTTFNADGIYQIVLPTGASREIQVIDEDGLVQATFDSTFDYTFRYYINPDSIVSKVGIDNDADEGIYLRWVDRFGMYRYWLFKEGDQSLKVTSNGEYVRNNILATEMTYGYNMSLLREQLRTSQKTSPICAPLVDDDTFDLLTTLAESAVVDMYIGKNSNNENMWLPVIVQAGTFTKSKDFVLQDFVANLTLPEWDNAHM